MLYLERSPHPALSPFIKTLWYACDPNAVHARQRVLPTGRAQIVISLARDYLTDANHPIDPFQPSAPAVFLGLYSAHQQIDAIDLASSSASLSMPAEPCPSSPTTPAFSPTARPPSKTLGRILPLSPRSSPRSTHVCAEVRSD